VICGNCGKPCTAVAEATSCCHYKQALVITVAPDSKLTKAQIEAIAAKLSANGLAPGTPVYDLSDPDADED
jgi:hypothetical protein